MTSKTLLAEAKRGNTDAIASLMNKTLAKQKSQIQIRKKDGHYKLLVVSASVPSQKATVSWIVKGLKQLGVQDLEQATIYGKHHQSTQPDWQQSIRFATKALEKESANTHTTIANQEPEAAERNSYEKEPENEAAIAQPEAEPQPEAEQNSQGLAPSASSADWSEYCFTRNKSLLKGDLTYPAECVAQLVLAFAALSDDQKQDALPHIEQALRKPVPIETEMSAEAKGWLEKIAKLEGPQIRKASIWLSRYCLDPVATVGQLDKSAIAQKAEEPAAEQNPQSDTADTSGIIEVDASTTHSSFPSTYDHSSTSAGSTSRSQRVSKTQLSDKPTLFSNMDGKPPWLIPAIWCACLLVMVTLGIMSASNATYAFPICAQSTADAEICNLAVQIVGDIDYLEYSVAELDKSAPDITPNSKSIALKDCQTVALGPTGQPAESQALPIALASQSTEVFPGVLLTDVTQPSAVDRTPVRTACVHFSTLITQQSREAYGQAGIEIAEGEGWPELMSLDEIPTDWPSEPYEGEIAADFSVAKALGIYNVFIMFGADTLFIAVGMFAVIFMGMAFSCYTLQGVYKAAFVAGIAGSALSYIPSFGIVAAIAREVLAIGIASAIVPEFKIDWSCGYWYVALATIVVGVTRALLSMLLFGAIAAIVFA